MKFKGVFLFVALMILLSISAIGDNYSTIGNDNGFRYNGASFFNTGLQRSETTIRAIDSNFVPLTVDLDGDGKAEIVVFDGDDIAVYNFSSLFGLQLIDSLDTDLDSTVNMMMTTQDIDNDGFQEIIAVSDGVSLVEIFEFDNTRTLSRQIQHSIAGGVNGRRMVSCNEQDLCTVVRTEQTTAGSDDIIRANFFNSTSISLNNHVIDTGLGESGNSIFCYPRIRNIETVDINNDGSDQFTMSFVKAQISGNELFKTATFSGVHSNLSFDSTPLLVTIQSSVDFTSSVDACPEVRNLISGPLVINVNGGGDLETVVGVSISTNDFVMFSVDTGGDTERFPNILLGNSEGTIVSNPIKMNAFDDSPNTQNPSDVDFCILGHDAQSNTLDLLCGSKLRADSFTDSTDYEYTLSAGLVLPDPNSIDYSPLIHSGEFQSIIGSGMDSNLDELVSTYGIFRLNNPLIGFDQLDLQFQNPITNASVIMADLEGLDRNQMVMCTSNSLTVVSDGFINSPARIVDPASIKPCPAQTWKLSVENNTEFLFVEFSVDDIDNDQVSARATLYADEGINKTIGFTANTTAGSTFSFQFEINETTPSSILRLEGRDTFNPTIIDVQEFPFSVALEGITSQDCTFNPNFGDINDNINGETPEERERRLSSEQKFQADLLGSQTNNSVRTFFGLGTDLTGVGITVLWVLAMLGGTFLLVTRSNFDSHTIIPVILIFNGLFVVAGILLGFFGLGLLIVLTILGILSVVVFFGKRIAGGGT